MARQSKDIAIEVKHVAKDFHLPHEKSNSIKTKIVSIFKKKNKDIDVQHALKDISFTVHKGEFFGIVGRNGSGKSTLLKIISQIYKPVRGSVTINGRLVPFIELGVGFNPELTGRENVFLNGALLGFSKKQMEEMYDDIVSFAELEDFMEQKLKNYSSGMQVRLAFSVAIRADSDILILDEVLAVGDEAFQRKCNDYFFKAKREGKTVVLVTHSMESVRKFCDRAVLVKEGKIFAEGNPDKVANEYSKMFVDEYIDEVEQKEVGPKKEEKSLSDVAIKAIQVLQSGKPVKVVKFQNDFSVDITMSAEKARQNVTMGVHVIDQAGRAITALSTKPLRRFDLKKGETHIRFDMQNILSEGEYYLALAIETKADKKLLIKESELSPFSVVGLDESQYSKFGLAYPKVTISVNEDQL